MADQNHGFFHDMKFQGDDAAACTDMRCNGEIMIFTISPWYSAGLQLPGSASDNQGCSCFCCWKDQTKDMCSREDFQWCELLHQAFCFCLSDKLDEMF